MPGSTVHHDSDGFQGDKRYQRLARDAFPLLVRQARARQPITYSDLAEELGTNPRYLSWVLGAIRHENLQLSESGEEGIPEIQTLVCRKDTGLPGLGVFAEPDRARRYESATLRLRHEMIQPLHEEVFAFRRWNEVLHHFGLRPTETDHKILAQAARFPGHGGVSESREHLELKKRIARHPEWFRLPRTSGPGEVEFPFASSDRVDVLFKSKKAWLAVEVKSARSPAADLARGLFQCVKYRSLLEATLRVEQRPLDARAVLALEEPLPQQLFALRNTLGVRDFVVDQKRSASEPL